MADKILSKKFAAARTAKYESHYSRIVASCISNFDAITNVRASSFNSALGAALESNTAQTVTAMEISDEEFKKLETNLKQIRLKTSNVLSEKKDVKQILSKALGTDIIDDDKIEKLISTVENKFSAFMEVKDRMAKKNLETQGEMFDVHKERNDALVADTVAKGTEKGTVFKASVSNKLSEAFGRAHGGFRKVFPDSKESSEVAVQAIGLLSGAVGIILTNRKAK